MLALARRFTKPFAAKLHKAQQFTSDFEEIEALCSRAFVFVRGACKAELNGAEVNVPRIAACLVNRTQSAEAVSVRQGV